MFAEDEQTSEVYEAEEVFYVVLPSGDQAAVVVQPCKKPLNLPSPSVAAQWSAILGLVLAVGAMRSNHLHATDTHRLIERVGVIGLVAYQPFR